MIVIYAPNVTPQHWTEGLERIELLHFTTPTACVWIVPGTADAACG